MYFRVFNFRTSQDVRKYFNNEIFVIYGGCTSFSYMNTCRVHVHLLYMTSFGFLYPQPSTSRYPHLACELLTAEVYTIIEKLSSSESLLQLLWSFLDSSSSLDPLVGSFISKVLAMLLNKENINHVVRSRKLYMYVRIFIIDVHKNALACTHKIPVSSLSGMFD